MEEHQISVLLPVLSQVVDFAWRGAERVELGTPEELEGVSPQLLVEQVESAATDGPPVEAKETVMTLRTAAETFKLAAEARVDAARESHFPYYCHGGRRAVERVNGGEHSSDADRLLAERYNEASHESRNWVKSWHAGTVPPDLTPTDEEDLLLRSGFAARAMAGALSFAVLVATKGVDQYGAERWRDSVLKSLRVAVGDHIVSEWQQAHL